MALAKAVILERVDLDNPPYVYVEDTVNVDEDGEGMLYTVGEFMEEIKKGKWQQMSVADCIFRFVCSGWTDTERDFTHLAKAYNLAHGLEKS